MEFKRIFFLFLFTFLFCYNLYVYKMKNLYIKVTVRPMIKRIEAILEKKRIPLAIIAGLTILIYCNSFSAPFTLDDFGSISNNYAIRNLLDFMAIWRFYSNRFLLYVSLSINYAIHSTAVEGYHITNVALHIFNSFLVFLILHSLLGLEYFKRKLPGKYRNIVSLLCALVFVSHPVQVNAVTYIVQRTAALAAMFYFLAILFYIRYRTRDKVRYFLLTLLFTVMAMFTKENTITIPFMLGLLEFMFFLKDGKTLWRKRIAILFILLLTVPIIPATNLYLGGYSQSDPGVSFKASTGMDRFEYFYTEQNVIVTYIKQIFVPNNLNFDYSDDFPRSKTIWQHYSYISFAALLGIGLIALLSLRKNKLLSLGILWFFMGLAVESSFISIKDVYFEHRLYFPMVGFTLFLAGVVFMERKKRGRRYTRYLFRKPLLIFMSVLCVLTVAYSAVTLQRNYIFSDSIRLWADVVKKAPNSDRGHCVLATGYLNFYDDSKEKKPELLDKAEKEFKKAIELNYYNSTAHCNLSKVYYYKKNYDKAIYEAEVTNGMKKSQYAYFNIGLSYECLGQTEKAIQAYTSGYGVDNKCTFVIKALGNIYYKNKDYDHARYYFKEFLKYNQYSDSAEIKKKLDEISKTGT